MDIEDKAHDVCCSIRCVASWLDVVENKKKKKLSE
ncbi:hypothetical protein A2U01_0104407, partial [Trifolium medium]|nr:hypothetical protein [Trifolium medium]